MFKAYNASAGSGKTTNLVIEYLSLCFQDIQKYKHILAITFTNNATAEMKERIVSYLELFAFTPFEDLTSESDKVLYNSILSKCSTTNSALSDVTKAHKFMQEKSQILLENILYDYANFSISTIDSFFQRILRAFAFDLHLNLNFNLEVSLDDLYTQAIDLLLNKISVNEKDLTQRTIALIDKQLENNGRWKIENELLKILNDFIYKEESYYPLKELSKIDTRDLQKSCKDFISKRINTQNNIRKEITEYCKQGNDMLQDFSQEQFFQGSKGLYGWFSRTEQKFPNISINSYLTKCINERKSFTKGNEDAKIFDELCSLIEKINTLTIIYITNNKLGSEIEQLQLLFDLKEIMDEIKLRDNLFFLSEANAKIYEEIKDEEAPYIYEKIGNKYQYFFIDEFQDTSKMQWENILPLVKNALGSGGETIIFGDLKQAIYRFRGGEASLFDQLSDETKFSHLDIHSTFCKVPLDTNYRSAKSIVEFNNNCFENVSNIIPFYAEKQKIDINNHISGFVSVHFKPENITSEDNLIDTTILMVEDALKRNFEYRDMAILTKNRATSSTIAQRLSANGHPVISSDSLLLAASTKIQLIINTLKYISNPEDKIAQFAILSQLSNTTENTAIEEQINYITQNKFINLLREKFGITLSIKQLRTLPLFALVKKIITLYQLNDTDAYVIRFLDAIFDFVNKETEDLTQFLNWWETKQEKISVIATKDDNAITVTTIHQAKGLGYPVVIIPLNSYKEFTAKTIWHKTDMDNLPFLPVKMDRSLENIPELKDYYTKEKEAAYIDNINVLYVAQTRAREALYIITSNNSNYGKILNTFLEQKNESINTIKEGEEYIFGDVKYKHCLKNKKKSSQEDVAITELHSKDFSPEELISLPRLESNKQRIGLVVHGFLASLEHFPQTIEELENTSIDLEESAIPFVEKILRKIIEDKTLTPYFATDTKVLNEVSIIDKNGNIHRPDRVALMENEVMVMDYKTGQANDAYEQQINKYISLLQEMGYKNVHGKLIYID